MKVFHISGGDATAETNRRLVALATALAGTGAEQTVLIAPDDALRTVLEARGLSCHVQKFAGLFDLRTPQAAQKIAGDFVPAIIHAHTADAAFIAGKIIAPAAIVGYDTGKAEQTGKAATVYDLLLDEACRSQAPASGDGQMFTVRPLVPMDEGTTAAPSVPDRNAAGVPPQAVLSGILIDRPGQYDVEPVLNACRELSAFRLWVAGREEDRKQVREKARKFAVHDKVHFIDAAATDSLSFLRALDIVIVPHDKDGGGDRTIIQAWAAGLCVLHGETAALSPVAHDETGWLVPDNKVLAWREALSALGADPALRAKLGQSGREQYTQSFTPERIAGDYLTAYEAAVQRRVSRQSTPPAAATETD